MGNMENTGNTDKDVRILTCSVRDEECFHGWDKDTIEYLKKNEGNVKRYLRGIVRKNRADNLIDVDDLIGEVYVALYTGKDYDLDRAVKEDGDIIPLEGYVKVVAKFIAIKAISKAFKVEKVTARPKKVGEEEYTPLDTISDGDSVEQMERIGYDLNDICEMCEPHRNKYGVDLYMLFYVRLMIGNTGNSEEVYKRVLDSLGVRKKDLEEFKESSRKDDNILSIAKAINKCGENAVEVLEKYVYAADRIKKLVASVQM